LEKSQMPTHDSVDKELVFPGLTRVFLGQGTTSIKIEGHFTYDNGFGHKNRGSTCQQFMRVATVSNPGGRLWGESFVQCDKVAETESTNAYYADEINKSKK